MTATLSWKSLAAEAEAAGYAPGNPWEALLLRHLTRTDPAKVAELTAAGDLTPYLRAAAAAAVKAEDLMLAQGTPPDVARELTMAQLLPPGADEE